MWIKESEKDIELQIVLDVIEELLAFRNKLLKSKYFQESSGRELVSFRQRMKRINVKRIRQIWTERKESERNN